jgi:hypothetical protein
MLIWRAGTQARSGPPVPATAAGSCASAVAPAAPLRLSLQAVVPPVQSGSAACTASPGAPLPRLAILCMKLRMPRPQPLPRFLRIRDGDPHQSTTGPAGAVGSLSSEPGAERLTPVRSRFLVRAGPTVQPSAAGSTTMSVFTVPMSRCAVSPMMLLRSAACRAALPTMTTSAEILSAISARPRCGEPSAT